MEFLEFIEAPLFSKYVSEYLTESEYFSLQWELTLYPDKGDLIQKSGGLRKIRWGMKERGKRGGARVIYYWKSKNSQIFLLSIYAKNEVENISNKQLQELRKELGK